MHSNRWRDMQPGGVPPGGPGMTLTLHWNGSTWSHVASPNVGTDFNDLSAVTGSGSDVWAAGSYASSRTDPDAALERQRMVADTQALILAQDGNRVYAITGSGNDVWAVGIYWNGFFNPRTLTLHWDGSAWSVVPSPNVGSDQNWLNGVTGSGNDVWAVGWYHSR